MNLLVFAKCSNSERDPIRSNFSLHNRSMRWMKLNRVRKVFDGEKRHGDVVNGDKHWIQKYRSFSLYFQTAPVCPTALSVSLALTRTVVLFVISLLLRSQLTILATKCKLFIIIFHFFFIHPCNICCSFVNNIFRLFMMVFIPFDLCLHFFRCLSSFMILRFTANIGVPNTVVQLFIASPLMFWIDFLWICCITSGWHSFFSAEQCLFCPWMIFLLDPTLITLFRTLFKYVAASCPSREFSSVSHVPSLHCVSA